MIRFSMLYLLLVITIIGCDTNSIQNKDKPEDSTNQVQSEHKIRADNLIHDWRLPFLDRTKENLKLEQREKKKGAIKIFFSTGNIEIINASLTEVPGGVFTIKKCETVDEKLVVEADVYLYTLDDAKHVLKSFASRKRQKSLISNIKIINP